MNVLVPIDGSDCSTRALEFAVEFGRRFDASLRIVHFTDAETEATDAIRDAAERALAGSGVDYRVDVQVDDDLEFRPAEHVGENVLALVADDEFDHVVMGHHGSGTVERAILGSAAETVLRAERVPVTVVP